MPPADHAHRAGCRCQDHPRIGRRELLQVPKYGGAAEASLVYRFESYFPLDSVEVILDAAASGASRNTLAISTDDSAP